MQVSEGCSPWRMGLLHKKVTELGLLQPPHPFHLGDLRIQQASDRKQQAMFARHPYSG